MTYYNMHSTHTVIRWYLASYPGHNGGEKVWPGYEANWYHTNVFTQICEGMRYVVVVQCKPNNNLEQGAASNVQWWLQVMCIHI